MSKLNCFALFCIDYVSQFQIVIGALTLSISMRYTDYFRVLLNYGFSFTRLNVYCFCCFTQLSHTSIYGRGVARILVRGGGSSDKIFSKVASISVRSGDIQKNLLNKDFKNFENLY